MPRLPSPTANPDLEVLPAQTGEPMKVRFEETQVEKDLETRDLFWVGTTPDSPIQNVTCGIRFPAFTGQLDYDGKGEPVIPNSRGALIRLSPAEVKLVLKRVPLYVVRARGRTSFVVSKAQKAYVPNPGDVPLAKFLYMVRLEERMPIGWRSSTPEPMLADPEPEVEPEVAEDAGQEE
jgi:hypothetical protein